MCHTLSVNTLKSIASQFVSVVTRKNYMEVRKVIKTLSFVNIVPLHSTDFSFVASASSSLLAGRRCAAQMVTIVMGIDAMSVNQGAAPGIELMIALVNAGKA